MTSSSTYAKWYALNFKRPSTHFHPPLWWRLFSYFAGVGTTRLLGIVQFGIQNIYLILLLVTLLTANTTFSPCLPTSMEMFGTLKWSKIIDDPIKESKWPVVYASASSTLLRRNFNPIKVSLAPWSIWLLFTSDKVALDCKNHMCFGEKNRVELVESFYNG